MPIILTLGFVGWFCKIDMIVIPLLCVYVGLLLAICDDVRNVFPVAISAQFFINSVESIADYVVLGVSILFFVVGIVIFLIRQLYINKVCVKKGKMFWPFVVALVAYLIGGIWGYFNILNAVIITAMTCATYFLYWIAINFSHNLKEYINYFFIALGIVLGFQLIISYAFVEEKFSIAILSKSVIWIGLQNINIVTTYFILAMLSTFQLALRHKYDYLISLGAMMFALCAYFTYCRMGVLIAFIIMCIALVYVFAKSRNKQIFLYIGIVGAFVLAISLIFKFDDISKIFNHYLTYGFSSNGRDVLYSFCMEKFLDSPVFGVGFTTTDHVPFMAGDIDNIILAHNTPLQYLTSCGIVGTLIISYYYYSRWKVALTKFNEFKFWNVLSLLVIALQGITDQSPTMDIFVIIIITILVSLAELDTDKILAETDPVAPPSADHKDTIETSAKAPQDKPVDTNPTPRKKTRSSTKNVENKS